MSYDKRPPVMTMGKNRYDDVFECASAHGFSVEDADHIAYWLPKTWDGMDGLHKAFWAFIRDDSNRRCLSSTGQNLSVALIAKADSQ